MFKLGEEIKTSSYILKADIITITVTIILILMIIDNYNNNYRS